MSLLRLGADGQGRARLGLVGFGKVRRGEAKLYKSNRGGEKMNTVKVGELVIDYGILPRAGVNHTHVDTLKNAALAGESFPPIIAERSTRRVVDGLHRLTMYVQLYGTEYEVEVEFRGYANEDELFVAAVAANSTHGLAYTTYDRRRILVEAERRGISREVISSAIKMPVEKAEKKLADGSAFVKTPIGQRERVPLRTGLKGLAGRDLNKKQVEANEKAGMRAEYHCEALVALLRAGLLSWCSKTVRGAVVALHKELAKQV